MFHRPVCFAACLVATILLAGCNPPPDPTLDLLDSQLSSIKIDDLARTMEFVFSENRFEQQQFEEKISTGLNRWATIRGDELNAPWELDPMAAKLIEQFPTLPLLDRTSELSFLNTDAYYLQQVAWIDVLTRRLTRSRYMKGFEIYRLAAGGDPWSDELKVDPLVPVIQKLHPDLSNDQPKQLADSIRLFDWIVRNIQLLPETEYGDQEREDQILFAEEKQPSSQGVRGTGYIRYPWQVLLYSRGDYVERAKLFILMANQIGLDAVMLSTESTDADGTTTRQPWCPAVVIGDQYYLFDTRLGLPIPAGRPGTVATLEQVRANPDLLKWLDLTIDESLRDDTKYWIHGDQVKTVNAMIYVAPEAIAKRFKQVEANLTGDQRLTLTRSPSEIASRLPKPDGLAVLPWDIAFKTHAFRQAVREAEKQASFDDVLREKLRWHFFEETYIDDFTLYRTARAKYFKGIFETVRNDKKANAIELFYILMYDDKTITSLGTNKTLQRQLGIFDDLMSVQEMQIRIQTVQGQMRLVRRDSGLFLAECHFDNDNVGTAANWLKRLRRRSETNERWRDGIEYLLARCYEARKEYAESIKTLQNDDLIQFHGNLIRARMLKQLAQPTAKP